MPRYSWLLFDADGTLFDFEKAERNALHLVLEDLGHPASDAVLQIYHQINDRLWRALEVGTIRQAEINPRRFHLWLNELGLTANSSDAASRYIRHLSEQTALLDGAQAVVEQLAASYKLMIVTNGLKDVQRPRLERSSLRPYLHDFVISEELGVSKPHRYFFDATFQRMGEPAKETVLMIGDSLAADIEGGLAYGLDTCWCNFNNQQSDSLTTHTITRLDQLLHFL